MPITISTKLGLELPGAAVGDLRLADLNAVKNTLITLDSTVGSYIKNNSVPTKIPCIASLTCDTNGRLDLDESITNNVSFYFDTFLIPNDTVIEWSVTGLSTSSITIELVGQNTYVESSGTVITNNGVGGFTVSILPHIRLANIEWFKVRVGKSGTPDVAITFIEMNIPLYNIKVIPPTPPLVPAINSVVANPSSIDRNASWNLGTIVTYTVTTTDIPDNTNLITTPDTGGNTSTCTIVNNTGTFTYEVNSSQLSTLYGGAGVGPVSMVVDYRINDISQCAPVTCIINSVALPLAVLNITASKTSVVPDEVNVYTFTTQGVTDFDNDINANIALNVHGGVGKMTVNFNNVIRVSANIYTMDSVATWSGSGAYSNCYYYIAFYDPNGGATITMPNVIIN